MAAPNPEIRNQIPAEADTTSKNWGNETGQASTPWGKYGVQSVYQAPPQPHISSRWGNTLTRVKSETVIVHDFAIFGLIL